MGRNMKDNKEFDQFEDEKDFIQSLNLPLPYTSIDFDLSSGENWSTMKRKDDPRTSYSSNYGEFEIVVCLYKDEENYGWSIDVNVIGVDGLKNKTFTYHRMSWAYDAFCKFINQDDFWIEIDLEMFKILKSDN